MVEVAGLLLAAGAGTRMGVPKALLPGALHRAVTVLFEGGCDTVTVVLGAAYGQARPLVPDTAAVVRAQDWATGMGASLRAGLASVTGDAALVHLIDLPDVGAPVVRRLLSLGDRSVLARATYAGLPGHPVIIGRDHWAGVVSSAVGDRGAREYLAAHDVIGVPCDDLATGRDTDRPGD